MVADGYDTGAVITALLTLQQRYTGIKKTADEAQILILLEDLKVAAIIGQRTSYVETKIRQMKLLWRNIFPQKMASLPTLTICEIMLLMSYTTRIINSIPFPGQTKICPADLLGFNKIEPVELDTTGTNIKKLDERLTKLKEHRDTLLRELLKIKLASKEIYLKRKDGSIDVEVSPGDVVIIRNKNLPFGECEKIGEVLNTTSTTAIVRTKTKTDSFLKKDLTVLVKQVPSEH